MRSNWIKTPGFDKLEAKLLAIGGERVLAMPESYLDILLERGRIFSATGTKKVRGTRHRCHQNAALQYARHHIAGNGTCKIVSGYGLYDDGVWVQHSWVWDGARVIETTSVPKLYFGVVLTPGEALKFTFCNLMPQLPGYNDMLGRKADQRVG
jgi:hypothetical protein